MSIVSMLRAPDIVRINGVCGEATKDQKKLYPKTTKEEAKI
jgi:hypothetical protein